MGKNNNRLAIGLFIFATLLNTGCVGKFSNFLEFSPSEELMWTPGPYAGQGRLVVIEGQAFPNDGRPREKVATLTSHPGVRISLIQSSNGTVIYKAHGIGSFYEHLSGAANAAIPAGMIVQLPAGTYKLGARYRKKNLLGIVEYSSQDLYVTEDLQIGRHYMLKGLFIKSVDSTYIIDAWNLKFEEVFPVSPMSLADEKIGERIPEGDLSTSIIELLFSNKTVSGTHVQKGFIFKRFFSSDGTIYGEKDTKDAGQGKWRASSKGLCIEWTGKQEKCRVVTRENNIIKAYKVNKKNKRTLVKRYSSFETSNLLNSPNVK